MDHHYHIHLHDTFKESEHPRASEGKSEGGQFVKKGTGGGGKSAIGGNPDKELKRLGLKTSGPVEVPKGEEQYIPIQEWHLYSPWLSVYQYTNSWGIYIPGFGLKENEKGRTYEEVVSVLTNFKKVFNDYKAFKKQSTEKATRAEIKALRFYKQSEGYQTINDCLRFEKECDNKTKESIAGIESFLDRSTAPTNITTYRTIDYASKYYSLENIEPGSIISDAAFMSTSAINAGAPEKRLDVLTMVINIQKGTKGVADIDKFDKEGGGEEYELLLQKGSRFKVIKYNKAQSELHLEML